VLPSVVTGTPRTRKCVSLPALANSLTVPSSVTTPTFGSKRRTATAVATSLPLAASKLPRTCIVRPSITSLARPHVKVVAAVICTGTPSITGSLHGFAPLQPLTGPSKRTAVWFAKLRRSTRMKRASTALPTTAPTLHIAIVWPLASVAPDGKIVVPLV